MRLKKGFKLHQMGDEYIVIAQGLEHVDFNYMISLNKTGGWLWKSLSDKDFNHKTIVELLINRFEVSADQASYDAEQFVTHLIQAKVVES